MAKKIDAMEVNIKAKVGRDAKWAEVAILALYARQTASEQSEHVTKENNAKGFNGVDAEILSSFAEQIERSTRAKGDRLSPKQLAIAFKKLPKYAHQLFIVAQEKAYAKIEHYYAVEMPAEAQKMDNALAAHIEKHGPLTSPMGDDPTSVDFNAKWIEYKNKFGQVEAQQEARAFMSDTN